LRLAHRIKYDSPDTDTSIFYIDIQTFGKDFESFFKKVKQQVRLIRTIPGDIFLTDDNRLRVTYYDTAPKEECFDLVVLSVGLLPKYDALRPFSSSATPFSEDSAPWTYENRSLPLQSGVFPAGSVLAPMNIEDAVTSAKHAVSEVATYLGKRKNGTSFDTSYIDN
jgi:heterodisulfide reductase subunit A